jgi:hypothetical protein
MSQSFLSSVMVALGKTVEEQAASIVFQAAVD